jgi:hypothetical protein
VIDKTTLLLRDPKIECLKDIQLVLFYLKTPAPRRFELLERYRALICKSLAGLRFARARLSQRIKKILDRKRYQLSCTPVVHSRKQLGNDGLLQVIIPPVLLRES